MKRSLLFGILYALACVSQAQVPTLGQIPVIANIDSLEKMLPQKKGRDRLLTLLCLERSLSLWEILGNRTYIDQIKNELAPFPAAQGHYHYFKAKQESANRNTYDKAFSESKWAYEYYKNQGDSLGVVSALLNMGELMLFRESNAPQNERFGQHYFKEIMELSQHTANVELQIVHALAFTRSLDRTAYSIDNKKLMTTLHHTLDLINKYPRYVYYKPFLLNILAMVHEQKQQFAQAQQYTFEIINMLRNNGRPVPVTMVTNLASLYEMQHKYPQALKSYREALFIAHRYRDHSIKPKLDISMGIHASLVGLNKYREAATWADSIYIYAEQYNLINTKTKLQEAAVTYEVEKKEVANKLLTQQKQFAEIQSQLYLVLSLAAAIGLLTTSFFLYRLRSANKKIKHAYDDILQLNQARDHFFGVIAHDLRRPLSSFQDMAELINYYLNSQRYAELEKVSHSIDRMGKHIRLLLDNLLNWALTQRDEVPYNPEKIVLLEKITPVIDLYQQAAHFKKVNIKVECPEHLAAYMDPDAFDLILRNLLDNALKNSHSGGEITLKASSEESKEKVRLIIEDNGKGMSTENLQTIQHTLQQSKLQPNRPRGMGMILLGRFIKSNRGNVSVSSILEKGTTFTLSFPM